MFRNGIFCLFSTSLEETLPWCELNSHLVQCHLPQGLIRSCRAKDTPKPRFRFLFQKALGKKKDQLLLRKVCLAILHPRHRKFQLLPHPYGTQSTLRTFKCKLPQISKTGPKADGRSLTFHTAGFCEYLSLETGYSNTGRFSRRQNWWDWFLLRSSLAVCVWAATLSRQKARSWHLRKGGKKIKDSWRYITCLIETISFTGKQLHLSVLLIRTKCCNYDSIHNVL